MSPPSRLEISIPTASFDGVFHGRYPHGDAPSGAILAGAASDSTSASGTLGGSSGLAITTTTLANATVGVPYFAVVTAANGTTPYTNFGISSASPNRNGWLNVTPISATTFYLWGVPGFAGTESIVLSVTDSSSNTAFSSSLSLTISAAATGASADPTQLPFASAVSPLSGSGLTSFLATARATAAGSTWSDPSTAIPVMRVTDASTPATGNSTHGFAVQYSEQGLQISLPWGTSGNQYTIFFWDNGGGGHLVDYTLSSGNGIGTLANYRSCPASPGQMCFSRVSPQILYYKTSSTLHRYNTATNALAETGTIFPISWATQTSNQPNTWLQVNLTDTWATGIATGGTKGLPTACNMVTGATQVYAGNVNSGTWTQAQQEASLDELYIGYGTKAMINNDAGGSGVSLAFIWDLVANQFQVISPTLPFQSQGVSHVPRMNGFWTILNSNNGVGHLTLAHVDETGKLTQPNATFNGQISGSVLTVNSLTNGNPILPGTPLKGTGVTYGNTLILYQLSGTSNGPGTYQLSTSFGTIAAEAMSAGANSTNGGSIQSDFSGGTAYYSQWHDSGHWSQPPGKNQWQYISMDGAPGGGNNANFQFGNYLLNNGSGVMYCLNYHYSNDANSVFGGDPYWSQPHGSISNDGKVLIWNSELDGNGRLDIFLSETPRV